MRIINAVRRAAGGIGDASHAATRVVLNAELLGDRRLAVDRGGAGADGDRPTCGVVARDGLHASRVRGRQEATRRAEDGRADGSRAIGFGDRQQAVGAVGAGKGRGATFGISDGGELAISVVRQLRHAPQRVDDLRRLVLRVVPRHHVSGLPFALFCSRNGCHSRGVSEEVVFVVRGGTVGERGFGEPASSPCVREAVASAA